MTSAAASTSSRRVASGSAPILALKAACTCLSTGSGSTGSDHVLPVAAREVIAAVNSMMASGFPRASARIRARIGPVRSPAR